VLRFAGLRVVFRTVSIGAYRFFGTVKGRRREIRERERLREEIEGDVKD